MPFGEQVQCYKCDKNESFMWYEGEKGIQCNGCFESEQLAAKVIKKEEEQPSATVEKPKSIIQKNTRITYCYKTRQNPNALPKQVTPKGKWRRNIFKKNPTIKLEPAKTSFINSDSVYYEGEYYRIGDIVSVVDVGGKVYYAQITALITDQYCEKSAYITWLFPTLNESPFAKKGFDPQHYILGLVDDEPRKLECLQFVMHTPSEYYQVYGPCPNGMPSL